MSLFDSTYIKYTKLIFLMTDKCILKSLQIRKKIIIRNFEEFGATFTTIPLKNGSSLSN